LLANKTLREKISKFLTFLTTKKKQKKETSLTSRKERVYWLKSQKISDKLCFQMELNILF
jgi:hypothetical protein